MRILIIIPYFGSCPEWIDYFLQSCRYNPSVTWLIYSNIDKPDNCPSNVFFTKKKLSDFNDLASEKLQLKIRISNPYKICDLKPAFGEIFKEYISGFDFWGYSDIDLIYGDIRSFITDNILEKYDLISVRKDYIAGHFTIYKNEEKTNLLYKKCCHYAEIFKDNSHYFAFDEQSNIVGRRLYKTVKAGFLINTLSIVDKLIRKIKIRLTKTKYSYCKDITQITEILVKNCYLNLYKKDMVRSDLRLGEKGFNNWKIIWHSGKLKVADNNEEILHFHLYKLKSNKNLKIDKWKQNNKFWISKNGIYIE